MQPYLLPGLEMGPKTIGNLLALMPSNLIDVPTHPGRFTPREVIAHLADWEPIFRDERIRIASTQPGATVVVYDETERAERLNYAATDWKEELEKWASEREKTIELLSSIPREAWQNVVIHPERGEMTLSNLANMLLGHDMYHVSQLVEALKAGS
jgi:hypothetical protein